MTESTPPLPPEPGTDPLDDAASATVDGLLLDDASGSIDPALLAERVAELSVVTGLLAEPIPTPEPSIIDAHISAALDALQSDTPTESAPAGEPAEAVVVPLSEHRRRPSTTRWLAVAAAIAVVALAIPLVQSLSKGSLSSTDTAASAAAGDAEPQSSDAQAESRTMDNGDLSTPDTSSGTPSLEPSTATKQTTGGDLGTAESPQELAALVQVAAPDATGESTTQTTVTTDGFVGSTSTTTSPLVRSATPTCDAATRATHPELGALRYSATATLHSIPVEVAIYEVPDPTKVTYRLIATAVTDCRVLVDQIYP